MRISDWSSDVCSSDLAGESQVDARAEMAGDQADDGDSDPDAQEMEADGEPEMGGEGDEGMLPVRPNRLPSDIPDFNYLRFTEKHDEIILATELCEADALTLRAEETKSEIQSLMR